jgi:Ca2+-binding EF-hand superfamily protein
VVLDTNNDKAIEASELRAAVQSTVQGLFATADTNRDGQISQTEMNAAAAGISRAVADAAFRQADINNDGQISQAEFEAAIVEASRVAFRIIDLNHDGQISPSEAQTIRQVLMSRLRMLNLPEASNSPRNAVNNALATPAQPSPTPAPATNRPPQP